MTKKDKEKEKVKKLQEAFNPSARDPFPPKKDEAAEEAMKGVEASLESLAAAMMAKGKPYEKVQEEDEDQDTKEE